jgi:DNA-binding YbaB/EbfC family protein
MQQAQKAQREIQKKLEEFEQKIFEFDYKNGSIVIQMSGNYKIHKITINPVLIDPEDKITLEEMIEEAINSSIVAITEDRDNIQQSAMPKTPGLF